MSAIFAKNKNLVIVCAGDYSLHINWQTKPRDYDLMVIYYGDNEEKVSFYQANCEYFYRSKGYKIQLARKILFEQLFLKQNFNFQQYDYIWFPDDDLLFYKPECVSEMFETASLLGADMFQPALLNENIDSHWSSTKKMQGMYCHAVNIVEIMGFGFNSSTFVHGVLPALHVFDYMNAGWGIEPCIVKLAEASLRRKVKVFVLDNVPILHTKPINEQSELHRRGKFEAFFTIQHLSNRMVTVAAYKDLTEAQTGLEHQSFDNSVYSTYVYDSIAQDFYSRFLN
jgi:hypothetical protein